MREQSLREFHQPAHLRTAEFHLSSRVFRERLVDLEIGCGVGLHALRRAAEHPERCLLAIERTKNKFQKFRRRLDHHPHLENLVAVHADAITWIDRFVPEEAVEEIFLLYPNPNPKRASQRWFRMPFMGRLLKSLKPAGRLHLATNEEFYFQEALECAQSLWGLRVLEHRRFQAGEREPRTHFERKYLERGESCYDLVLEKPRERGMQ